MEQKWWKRSVVYQIYPRSFMDSNGDGVGDLNGIISRLTYIQKLGADIIWLCPVYRSPNDDNGYDISDYRDIMAEFGAMADFDRLLEKAHSLGLKIMMDLVVNHSSDEHAWFVESQRSRANPYRDFYIWRDGKKDGPPNNWGASFGGSAWAQAGPTGQYYLHLFSPKQPDLNWENPSLRQAVYSLMHFWLDKGVDGFRMDVINYISKVPGLPDGKVRDGSYGDFGPYCLNGPRIHEFLKEMHREVLGHYPIVTVGEMPGVSTDQARLYTAPEEKELDMVFQFEHMAVDNDENGRWTTNRFRLDDLRRVLSHWQTALHGTGWNSLYWNNHDQPRVVSRFGDDSTPEKRAASAKMLGTLLHMMEGTPYVYQGEELGMTNIAFDRIEDYRDIETLNVYDEYTRQRGVAPQDMLRRLHCRSRDNARTPMQWDDTKNAGFTTGTPWIGVNPNYRQINAASQIDDENSVFSYYRRLIRLRKEIDVITEGDYTLLLPDHPWLFAYQRTIPDQRLTVLCGFNGEEADCADALPFCKGRLLLSNYGEANGTIWRPYEARVYLEEGDAL